MKGLLILIVIAGLLLTACNGEISGNFSRNASSYFRSVDVFKENMTCEQLQKCYDERMNCCLEFIDKPFKNWDCKVYGERGGSADYVLEMVKKCSV